MNSLIKLFTPVLIPVFFIACHDVDSIPPPLVDGDKTINKLGAKYKCEDIEFENWEDDDKDDSTLTICLINSKALPSGSTDESYSELKEIASQIKHSLKNQEQFNSYYVIFVKRDDKLGMQTRVHTMGSEFRSTDL